MQEQVFVGREPELVRLRGYLDKALAGQGQVCFVTGQAGSGKTALVHHFFEQALTADPDLVVAAGACNAQTGIGDPYLPFREALAMLTGNAAARQAASGIAPENAARLRAVLVRSVQVLVEVAPELVGVLVPGASLAGALGRAVARKAGWMDRLDELAKRKTAPGEPLAEQSRIFEEYTAFLLRLSAKTPVILFIDDLHWADGASIGLLFQLARHVESGRIVILGAYRPTDLALGRGGARHPLEPVVHELTRYLGDVSVDLDAIPETPCRQFVDDLLDAEPNRLGQAFREALFHQTGGHALFSVELIRAMQERGDLVRAGDGCWVEGASLDWDALPARVEGVIAERVDRLSEELRQLLTVGSVEGEQFTAEVVARVRAMSERQAVRELSDELQRQHRLISAQGIVQLGRVRLSLYRFLHNLFQKYMYDSLDEAERAYLHQDVGEVIEAIFAGQTEEVAAQLARHYEEAGIAAKAAAYRLQAGNRAHRMSADEEAAAHLTRGVELLADVPPGSDRTRLELSLQTALGTTLIATRGYASPQVEGAFVRARELCRGLGDPPQIIPVLYGQCMFHFVRGEMARAREEAEQSLSLARQADDIGYQLGCLLLLGEVAMYLGRFGEARAYLEQLIGLYDEGRDRDLAYAQGQDPCVLAHSYLTRVLWFQGYPEQALARQHQTLELAKELNHPYSLGLVTSLASVLYEMLRQWRECQEQAEEAMRLAGGGQFPVWQATAAMMHGVATAHQGNVDVGLAELSQGLATFMDTGAQLALPLFRALLAENHLLAHRQEEGIKAIEESLQQTDQIWWLPEQYRLRGELFLLTAGNEAEAEAAFRKALDEARKQGSKSLELRATMSLARLLRQQGQAAEGKELLSRCYAWFTEGFDTPDLQDARELLDQLCKDDSRGATLQPESPHVANAANRAPE